MGTDGESHCMLAPYVLHYAFVCLHAPYACVRGTSEALLCIALASTTCRHATLMTAHIVSVTLSVCHCECDIASVTL